MRFLRVTYTRNSYITTLTVSIIKIKKTSYPLVYTSFILSLNCYLGARCTQLSALRANRPYSRGNIERKLRATPIGVRIIRSLHYIDTFLPGFTLCWSALSVRTLHLWREQPATSATIWGTDTAATSCEANPLVKYALDDSRTVQDLQRLVGAP